MNFTIDIDLIFMVITLGCIVFVLQALIDFNKHSSRIRPQLREVARIKAKHRDEIEKSTQSIAQAERDAEKLSEDVAELESKRTELEVVATELREKLSEGE